MGFASSGFLGVSSAGRDLGFPVPASVPSPAAVSQLDVEDCGGLCWARWEEGTVDGDGKV